jgi:hypoxanthine phosphoribosyltransferase
MKTMLDYKTFKNICLSMADNMKEYDPHEIIAVSRGGLSASHIIAKHLNIPIGMYSPKTSKILMNTNEYLSRVVFVEDLVAEGRTFELIYNEYSGFGIQYQFDWKFAPVLIDGKYQETDTFKEKLITYGIKTQHWIVMPYEEDEKMIEGDRGLNRDGSDQYGK